MNKRLFVANLPFRATEDDLRQAFGDYGFEVVSVRIIIDRETNRSKGYGFVEMQSPADAQKAIEEMNDQADLLGRALTVREAQERPEHGRNKRAW